MIKHSQHKWHRLGLRVLSSFEQNKVDEAAITGAQGESQAADKMICGWKK